MKLKIAIVLIGLTVPVSSAFSQYLEDALRFSQTEQGSTARTRSFGNAQTALGGDLSSLNSNPAGIGLFTKSELNFTPNFFNINSSSTYLSNPSNIEKDKAGIDQLGVVFHSPTKRFKGEDLTKGIVSVNFGASYNKNNNFNSRVDYSGTNPNSSFADYIADQSNFYLPSGASTSSSNPLPAGTLERMGYDNFLTEYSDDGYFATTEVNNVQNNIVYRSGSQSDFNIGGAINFQNQFYVGFSVGFSSLRYETNRDYVETGKTRSFTGQDPNLAGGAYRLNFRSNQITEGSGVNAKLGLIYRASPQVRIGLSFISPTWYSLSDSYSEVLDTYYTRSNGSAILPGYLNNEEEYPFDYNLRTPYKINGGIAITLNKFGLITTDIEYVDYSSINFSTGAYSSSDDVTLAKNTTRAIRDTYQGAVNFKVGAEIKLSPVMLRLGYNKMGNPYQSTNFKLDTYSAGIGYRVNNVYFDLAYISSVNKYQTRPYIISSNYPDYSFTGSGNIADIKEDKKNILATIGFRF